MTADKRFKRRVRARALRTGESYASARQRLLNPSEEPVMADDGKGTPLEDDIERVREAADFVQIVSDVAPLRKVGRRWTGLCPFHAETSPSFSVNAEEKLYYCFGCSAGGNLFRFVQETQQLDFAGSVEWVAATQGITLRDYR
jgi:hypothetical protein